MTLDGINLNDELYYTAAKIKDEETRKLEEEVLPKLIKLLRYSASTGSMEFKQSVDSLRKKLGVTPRDIRLLVPMLLKMHLNARIETFGYGMEASNYLIITWESPKGTAR